MEHYAGIDVSSESASVCVVDATGQSYVADAVTIGSLHQRHPQQPAGTTLNHDRVDDDLNALWLREPPRRTQPTFCASEDDRHPCRRSRRFGTRHE